MANSVLSATAVTRMALGILHQKLAFIERRQRVDGATEPCVFRGWRKALGWSQKQTAHVLAVTTRTIIGWERGTNPIGVQTRMVMEMITYLRGLSPEQFGAIERTALCTLRKRVIGLS